MIGLEGKVCKGVANDEQVAMKIFETEVICCMLRNCSEYLVVAFADICIVVWMK
jgi:hypothetical protein